MPPPPSQKGKFRPKKPMKKAIRPGAATVAATASESTSTPTVAFAPNSYGEDLGGNGSRNDGGRGRGRGGRGGRGRIPLPTGKVFFTGVEKKSSSAMKKAPTGSRSRKKIAPSTESSSEEVVGQLDIAIGSSKSQKGDTNKNSILDSLDFEEQDGDLPLPTPSSHGAPTLDGFMYESDSSQESVPSKRKTPQKDIMAPLNLPLQAESLPVGIGEAERPFPYEIPDSITSGGVKSMTEVIAQSAYSETGVSPFVGVRRSEDLEWERDSWFLVQLPTRLPPLKAKTEDTPNAMDIHDNKRDNVTSPDVQLSSISEVVTQPVSEISFDNVLKSAAAGRIGKIVVYKSGKTVLMMKGPNDEKEVRFNVTEGLTCGFLQQAVSTDSEHGKYTELGEVKKSIVVSPILDSEFSN